jgi:hypothetical protein
MSAEWAAHPSQPIQPTSTNQKTLFAPVNLSLMHFIKNIQVQMNPFCAKTLKLTIMWCHMATMALRGLNHIIAPIESISCWSLFYSVTSLTYVIASSHMPTLLFDLHGHAMLADSTEFPYKYYTFSTTHQQ